MRKTTTAYTSVAIVLLLLNFASLAQNGPGKIIRAAPAGTARNILDPNNDDWVSQTTAGFSGGDDVTTSEVNYKPILPYSVEPNSDLRRGPSNKFTDFVPGVDNASYYMFYFDPTPAAPASGDEALLFRMRMGSVMPGAKGYSILLDTDGKFGATGPNADPNYVAATTGTGGNPGFEREVVLATGGGTDGVLIYNVDGTDNPASPVVQSGWTNFSQIAIAATNDNADPDFYLDFYVANPAAVLGISPATPFRVVPTTVMAPKAAIGGPKSDIYGLADNNYKDPAAQYEAFVNAQPATNLNTLDDPNTNATNTARCTAAPTVNNNITPGASTSVSGTWAPAGLTGDRTQATIRIYIDGIYSGQSITTPVYSGTPVNWTVSGVNITAGRTITAKAVATGESECLSSNAVTATNCNNTNTPSTTGLAVTCISDRGIGGTFATGHQVTLTYINPTTLATSVLGGPAANGTVFGYNGNNFYYNSTNTNGSNITSPCGGGGQDVNNGAYYITTNAVGSSCQSAPVFACLGLTAAATPTISQANLYTSTTSINGTATAGAQVWLFINGQNRNTVTATGGNYSFSGLSLALNDVVEVRAITANSCMSAATSRTVTCFTTPPAVIADANNNLRGGQAITGTSGAPVGTIVRIYNAANTLVATTTVQGDGSWSTGNAGTTPATYTAVTGTSYYATAQNGSCGVSDNTVLYSAPTFTSTARCGTISTSPILNSTASLSGALTGAVAGTVVTIYQDGVAIASTTSGTTAWGPVNVTGLLYTGGVLQLGIKETSSAEVLCPTTYAVSCSAPAAPTLTYQSCTNCSGANNVNNGGTVTYTVGNLASNTFYSLKSTASTTPLAAGLWTAAAPPSTVSLTTYPLTTGGAQNAVVVATSVSAAGTCSALSSQSAFNVVLPVELLEFKGKRAGAANVLQWRTAMEVNVQHFEVQRSVDGRTFVTIGAQAPGVGSYSFRDEAPPAGTIYYRLRTVDVDASFSLSKVIALNSNGQALYLAAVYPNPFHQTVNINFNTTRAATVTISLVDAAGRVVKRSGFISTAGFNTTRLTGLDRLANGQYLLKLIAGETVLEQKLVKQAQ